MTVNQIANVNQVYASKEPAMEMYLIRNLVNNTMTARV